MALAVVQRFRECQNLLDSVVASLSAISNLTSQRIIVEEAARRVGPYPVSYTGIHDDYGGGGALLCCTNPLGMLLAFPESSVELVIAQHTDDVSALLRSLFSTQQMWHNKLQQAKEASQSRKQQGTSTAKTSSTFTGTRGIVKKHVENSDNSPRVMLGVHALLATLAQMHGWLQEMILALRGDLSSPPRAVQLSQCLSGSSSCAGGASGCIPILPLENVLEELPDRVRREWEICKAQHMVDEAWVLVAG